MQISSNAFPHCAPIAAQADKTASPGRGRATQTRSSWEILTKEESDEYAEFIRMIDMDQKWKLWKPLQSFP